MKHRALTITVIVCLFVFVTTLAAGIILAGTTIGWSEIGNSIRNGTFQDRFFSRMEGWGDLGFNRIGFSIDETRTDNLQGINTILVRAVSERVNVKEAGSELSARLSGTYVGAARLTWSAVREGSTLVISTQRPWMGLRMSNLTIDLQIPKSYAGNVEIRTVSGTCELVNSLDSAWKGFKFDGVSGAFQASAAVWPSLEIKTVSGAIRADAIKGRLLAATVSGGIDAGFAESIQESRIESVSGRISVSVPQQSRFSLLFTTVSGNLDSSRLPLQITSQANRRTEATYNGGGSLITAKTVSGALVVQPQAGAAGRS